MGAGALIGAIVGGAAFEAGVTLLGETLFASIVTGASLGYTLFDQRLEQSSPTYDFGALQNTRSQLLPVPVVYGRNKLAGNIIYQSEPGKTIHVLVGLGEGEIQSVTDIRANDIPIGDVKGASHTVYYGSGTQTPDSRNANNEALRHTAYIACTFTANEQVSGSAPTVTAIVEGLKVDVWNGSAWVKQYSRNPAYCLLDFLTSTRYGLGIPATKIDRESFKAVAAYCDELVDGEPRFQLDVVIDSQMEAPDALSQMLATFGGFLVYSDGMIRLRVERSEAPVQAFTMDTIVEGSFSYGQARRKDVPNRVVVEFVDPDGPEGAWERSKIVAEDEVDMDLTGEVRERAIQLWGVTRATQAGRMARFYLDSARRCNTFCEFKVGIGGLACEVGDVIAVSHDVPGWTGKLFRILSIEEDENDEMKLSCREYDPSIYHDRGVPYTLPAAPSLPNPFAPPASVQELSLIEQDTVLDDGTWVPGIAVTWTQPDDVSWRAGHVYISADNGATWQFVQRVEGAAYVVRLAAPGTYKVKVVSENARGIKEDFGTAATGTITVVGKDYPPSDVRWGTCTFEAQVVLRWQPVADKDLRAYEVRTDTNFGADDAGLVYRGDGTSYVITSPTQRSYTFYIKALDRSGNYSANASTITLENPAPPAPPAPTVTSFFSALWIEISPVTDADLQGYYLYVTPSDCDGNPLDGAVTARIRLGPVTKYTLQASPNSYFLIRVSAFDALGEGPQSPAVKAGTLYVTRDAIAPGTIESEHIASGAIKEAQMNWQTHLIY